ncbi:3'-5' exonuclease [Hydrogenimonas urashimensis]|uniref:3'-5' exonuclease n=1 Tax=Hydrogenimonas urashimensis TaxID=2740515 RepID=UPI001F2B7743|nr:3'-5' exonuclease [Hydrogenimonas urashimensis]
MRPLIDNIVSVIKKRGGKMELEEFRKLILKTRDSLFESVDTLMELVIASGLPIDIEGEEVILKTCFCPWREETFCVVDIETNGSVPNRSQIIEIGAIKWRNGEIIDRFESFAACSYLPYQISEITGINPEDLEGAPPLEKMLPRFKTFLGDALFVAHNVSFDYNFISHSFERFGLGVLGNRRLCTIELARRTIEAERYGLGHLNIALDINTLVHHRAFADAITATKVLEIGLKNVPETIVTTEELIDFTKMPVKKAKLLARSG